MPSFNIQYPRNSHAATFSDITISEIIPTRKHERKADHMVKVYLAKRPLLTEYIVAALYKREDGAMPNTLEKSVYVLACDL